jgi:hypothetical protein
LWRLADVTADDFHAHARTAFGHLSGRLFRDAFLVGFPSDEEGPVLVAGVEGPDTSVFAGLGPERSRRIREADFMVSDDPSEPPMPRPFTTSIGMHLSVIPDLIQEVLHRHDSSTVAFASVAYPVGQYEVSAVVRLDRMELDAQPSVILPAASPAEEFDEGERVPGEEIAENEGGESFSLARSLVWEFQRRCLDVLRAAPRPAAVRAAPGELLRAAGEELMRAVADRDGGDPLGTRSLFQACDTVSRLRYEQAESVGFLAFLPVDASRDDVFDGIVRLVEPVALEDHASFRKLVQVSSRKFVLVSDGAVVFGLGRVRETTSVEQLDFTVRFVGHHAWELWHGETALMRVRFGVPGLPLRRLRRAEFTDALASALPGTAAAEAQLWAVVEAAMRQGHGTTLVISTEAAEEAKRLGTQGIPFHPFSPTQEQVDRLTAIDGAVVLDPDGRCHAMGIILDGTAGSGGTRARGARFNSAVRYAAGHPGRCVILVVSEDGMVDLVPQPLVGGTGT